MNTVVITGATGTLGGALASVFAERGHEVIGVTRQPNAKALACERVVTNAQRTRADGEALLDLDPDLLILCAGAIEEEVGEHGLPLAETTRELFEIHAIFPSIVAIAAAERSREHPLDIVAIGSIADGMPSTFGPVYHASKIALHYMVQGVAPIAARSGVRLRLYRPGVIRGPLARAPMIRLNERGRRIRARRCDRAPEAWEVAARIARWIDGDDWIGSHDEPLSFRALGLLFTVAPNLYARIQHFGWRKASRFA